MPTLRERLLRLLKIFPTASLSSLHGLVMALERVILEVNGKEHGGNLAFTSSLFDDRGRHVILLFLDEPHQWKQENLVGVY